MAEEDKHMSLSKVQMAVIVALWGIVCAGGAAWATHMNERLSRVEDHVVEKIPNMLRQMLRDHESRPHKDAVDFRDLQSIDSRLQRIEQKIDALQKRAIK